MKTRRTILCGILGAALMLAFIACHNGSAETSITYTGSKNGKTYTLEITKNTGRAAYSPRTGDSYELTIDTDKSTGTVTKVEGDVLTLKPSNSETEFTATVSENTLVSLTGTITYTDKTEVSAPGALTPSGGGDGGGDGETGGTPSSLVEMVHVPGGSFEMGYVYAYENNTTTRPVHTVTLTGFYIGKYEVTQAQWYAVMGTTIKQLETAAMGGMSPGQGDNYPVYWVSWYDALVFCNKLSVADGLTPAYRISGSTDPDDWGSVPTFDYVTNPPTVLGDTGPWDAVTIDSGSNGYRLPTEAQWEYAARGGNGSPEDALSTNVFVDYDVAWYDRNSGNTSHVVGTKDPNELGIYDMIGNVEEWCWDWYGDYSSEAQTNPTGASSGSYRVIRGGWYEGDLVGWPYRLNGPPYRRVRALGFRVLRP